MFQELYDEMVTKYNESDNALLAVSYEVVAELTAEQCEIALRESGMRERKVNREVKMLNDPQIKYGIENLRNVLSMTLESRARKNGVR